MLANLFGDFVGDRVVRDVEDRQTDIVKWPHPAVFSESYMDGWVDIITESEITLVGVIVAEIEIVIARERVRHDLVMQIVAGPCVRAVRDEAPEDNNENHDERPWSGERHVSFFVVTKTTGL